ncbi:putative ribonuclease H-like domain-containing protein [Tanacetum coccineum]|uniref:Ribonuclease H-like domain-containing protein n=1 Tax=Tanacetum coccineum TaxID=301880 RepID=A0ABQ5CRG7_9ASTR
MDQFLQQKTAPQEEDQGIDLGNLSPSYAVSSTPHTRIHKDHPIDHVIGDVQSSVQTRRMTTSYSELGFLSAIYEGKTHQDLHTCLFACFLSQEEPKRVSKALSDPAWVEAMQEELLQFNYKMPYTRRKGLIMNEEMLPVAMIEAIRIFLAYASYMVSLSTNGCQKCFLNGSNLKRGMTSSFGSTKKELCEEFEKLMKDKFQMSSMGELTFFLGLQVQQRKKGIFISQDKYVQEILKKFNYTDVTTRPDIMYALCACARFQVSPKTFPSLAVKKIFRYLKEFCDKHNMVAYLEKSTGSAGFHPIIDFITRCHIHYALTKKPEVCVSFIRQFWRSAEIVTDDDGSVKIHATIDGHSLSISEDKLTISKRWHFTSMRFLITSYPSLFKPLKKTAWEQFSSNIAAAVICLATDRKFNFSRMIFDHMVSNISKHPSETKVFTMKMEILLEPTSNKLLDHLKMEMEMEIPSSSNVKLITECSDTTYTCYEVMKDLIKVSKLPQSLISWTFIARLRTKVEEWAVRCTFPRFTKLVVKLCDGKRSFNSEKKKQGSRLAPMPEMILNCLLQSMLYQGMKPSVETINPKTKGSKKKANTDAIPKRKPSTAPKEKKSGTGKQKTSELENISEADLTEAEQLKIVIKGDVKKLLAP